ncbi:MAG: hypothetical protein WBF17_23215 [Phycisphaerae bacterium]
MDVGVIGDEKALVQVMEPLTAATLEAESMAARDFPGFALRNVLRKVDDQDAVVPVMQAFLDGLEHRDSTMRTYCAHGLHENVSKIRDQAVLTSMVGPLTAAALQVDDSETKGLGAGGLAFSALKQVLDKVDDQAALRSIIPPMARALEARYVKRRRYAAHAVMLFAHKVRDKAALASLRQPLVTAHFSDPDRKVRDSAGLALKRTFGQVPKPKSP